MQLNLTSSVLYIQKRSWQLWNLRLEIVCMACADNDKIPGLGIETNISVVADAIYQGLLDVINLLVEMFTGTQLKLHQSVFLSMTV